MSEVLGQLFVFGPTWDGNLVSKADRDQLVADGLAFRWDGWNFLTKRGVQQAVAAGLLSARNTLWYKKATCQ